MSACRLLRLMASIQRPAGALQLADESPRGPVLSTTAGVCGIHLSSLPRDKESVLSPCRHGCPGEP